MASAQYALGAFLFTRCDPTRTGASESLRRSRRRPRRRHCVDLPVVTLSRSSSPRAARWRGCGSAAQTRRGGRARWSRSRMWCPISRSRSWRGSCRREMRTPSSRTYARRRRRGARTSGGSRARRGRPRGSQLCTRCPSKDAQAEALRMAGLDDDERRRRRGWRLRARPPAGDARRRRARIHRGHPRAPPRPIAPPSGRRQSRG